MDQEDSRSAQRQQMDELRKKLSDEIEKEDFDLTSASVIEISVELDQQIIEHYKNT